MQLPHAKCLHFEIKNDSYKGTRGEEGRGEGRNDEVKLCGLIDQGEKEKGRQFLSIFNTLYHICRHHRAPPIHSPIAPSTPPSHHPPPPLPPPSPHTNRHGRRTLVWARRVQHFVQKNHASSAPGADISHPLFLPVSPLSSPPASIFPDTCGSSLSDPIIGCHDDRLGTPGLKLRLSDSGIHVRPVPVL